MHSKMELPMSALGHELPRRGHPEMSVLPPKADTNVN